MASDVPQDPCREWLGIDAADLGDHRRVLGVAPGERDPLVVLRAADARLARLRSVKAGSLESVRVGFVKRVEAARESVLAAIAAAAPAAPAFRVPPPPSTLAPPPPAPQAAPAAPPPVPRPAVPVPAVPPPPAGPSAPAAVGPVVVRRIVYRKRTPVAGIAATLVSLSALAGGLGYYALVVKPQQAARVAEVARDRATAEADAEEKPDIRARSTTTAVADDGDRPPPRARPRRPRSPSSEPAQAATSATAQAATSATMASRDAAGAMPQPDPRVNAPAKPKPSATKDVAKDAGKPAAAAGMSDQEAAAEARRLDVTLGEVLAAVRAGEDADAARLLETAAAAARGTAARDRLAGWQRLVESHRKFFAGRTAALGALEPGARYEVGGRTVVIEKIDGGQCVFRVSGPARTVAIEKLPVGIVLAIVADWFGDDPAGDIAIAAFQLFRPEPEARLAREHLEKAGDAGADVDTLLPLCDDPLFTAADAETEGR
jgi:hypothetical protein